MLQGLKSPKNHKNLLKKTIAIEAAMV